MSRQTEAHRAAALFNLEEAMRQAERYLKSESPKPRLIRQKANKIMELENELRKAHFLHCEKSNIDIASDDATSFIQPKCDAAIDCVDECMLLIDEKEFNQTVNDEKKEKSAQESEETKRLKSQIIGDERYSKDIAKKIKELAAKKEFTADNCVVMRLYSERIQDIFDSLNQAWNTLIPLNDENENVINSQEVSDARLEIQGSISEAIVFTEKCAKLEEEKHTTSTPVVGTATSGTLRTHDSGSTKCEKIKNPTFSGDIRAFMNFQKDFKRIVEPNYKGAQLSYVLRESCLQGTAKALVQNIDSVEEIWEKLTDRYGDKLHLVEVVIKELNEIPAMKGSDDRKFISMVDVLEKGLQDLAAIDARAEIANAYTLKMLEGKLSRTLYLNWLKEEETTVGATRFEKLFTFLKAERKRVEKLVQRGEFLGKPGDGQEKKGRDPERSSHVGGGGQQTRDKDNCLLHPKVAHFTRRCREFKAMSTKEKAELVKATKGCILCLSANHINKPCPFATRWKPCDVDGGQELHSRLLHEAVVQGLSMHLTVKRNAHTLLLMQSIPTKEGVIRTFFDNGSTITLISTSYVKKRNMKGVRVTYELITVGNHVKVQQTFLHEITLYDIEGKEHIVQAYEIDNICGVMKAVNVDGVVRLFQNLKANDVQRQAGSVELLIGMEQIAIHPRHEVEREGMVLFSSIFSTGKVLGGSHHLLEASDDVNAAVVALSRARIVNTRVMFDKYLDPGIDGITTEQFGVMLPPKCGPCKKCKWCTSQVYQISRQEQLELTEIEKNLELDPIAQCWRTSYPYRCDPSIVLQDNFEQA